MPGRLVANKAQECEASSAIQCAGAEHASFLAIRLRGCEHEQGFLVPESDEVGASSDRNAKSCKRERAVPATSTDSADIEPTDRVLPQTGAGAHDDCFGVKEINRVVQNRKVGYASGHEVSGRHVVSQLGVADVDDVTVFIPPEAADARKVPCRGLAPQRPSLDYEAQAGSVGTLQDLRPRTSSGSGVSITSQLIISFASAGSV
jgi:hypothetical protein